MAMNGNRLPAGQGMAPPDGRSRRNQYNPHQQYSQQPFHYGQPYYNPNPMNSQGFYQYPPPYMPHYPNPGFASPYAGYPPHYGRTPPPATVPQYNPNAHFVPAAAQSRPQPPSAQPSPIVSSTGYQHTPEYSQTSLDPRPASQSSATPSTPPLPQITEPLYAEPESPEPKQRIEIFVPPVPWFPPASRVPWPIKYKGPKDQNPDLEGYFVWVANPSQFSRRSGALHNIFAVIFQEPSAETPTLPVAEGVESVDTSSTMILTPTESAESERNAAKNIVEVETQVENESVRQEPHAESRELDAPSESQEPVSEEHGPDVEADKVENQRELSDESKTLSARSELEPEAASQEDAAHTSPPETQPISSPIAESDKPSALAPKARPLLWTGLFKGTPAATAIPTKDAIPSTTEVSSAASSTVGNPKSESLADALNAYVTGARDNKVAFLEPRGLVNTGNMCYMNSVLQVLVFSTPFYDFLDQVGKRSAHSFKSDTPLLDAMIMFMREFSIIDSAVSVEKLRMRLKDNELEQYGEQFAPDYIYEVIRRLPRFSTMERGHQQDAEEFLGFLLEGLHEECAQIMQSSSANSSAMATPTNRPATPASESGNAEGDAGWHEVGRKQRAAVTRSSGAIKTSSPITKIFGGTLRSEFRVPGLQASITLQPFQPLQLDIGSPQVNNIVDALKGLTRPETIQGDFKSPRNAKTATKQVFIETLPQVLILHLKRFEYNNTGGTQKIWKKIGYPLELEIPKEVFSRQQQTNILNHGGLPKYRLTAVVYHHGKNASGGHYTVDVRRQEGREWIRLDDTIIRRIKSGDVAEGGSEEDPKVLAAAAKAHKKDSSTNKNPFSGIDADDEEEDPESKDGWQQVNGPSNANGSSKSWSAVANGANAAAKTGSATKSKADKFSMKDNKVAYLLFYQKI